MNLLIFTKAISNFTKLERDLKAETTAGALYSHLTMRGEDLELYYSQNLSQTQVDAVSALVNNFTDISVFDNLYSYLGREIDPFVDKLMREIRAKNIEMGISQLGKTADVLGFFELPISLPNKPRTVSLKGSLDTSSLTVTVEIANYFIANPSLYSDLAPFVTAERITEWRDKIIAHLSST